MVGSKDGFNDGLDEGAEEDDGLDEGIEDDVGPVDGPEEGLEEGKDVGAFDFDGALLCDGLELVLGADDGGLDEIDGAVVVSVPFPACKNRTLSSLDFSIEVGSTKARPFKIRRNPFSSSQCCPLHKLT